MRCGLGIGIEGGKSVEQARRGAGWYREQARPLAPNSRRRQGELIRAAFGRREARDRSWTANDDCVLAMRGWAPRGCSEMYSYETVTPEPVDMVGACCPFDANFGMPIHSLVSWLP